jgi:putative membrane protein
LITALTAVSPGRVVGFFGAITPVGDGVSVGRAVEVLEEVDGWFLVALLAGIATAVVAVTGVVEWADERAPRLLLGGFFGLIAASALILFREIQVNEPEEVLAAIVGFLVAFLAAGLELPVGEHSLLLVFVSGPVAVSAMIVPAYRDRCSSSSSGCTSTCHTRCTPSWTESG